MLLKDWGPFAPLHTSDWRSFFSRNHEKVSFVRHRWSKHILLNSSMSVSSNQFIFDMFDCDRLKTRVWHWVRRKEGSRSARETQDTSVTRPLWHKRFSLTVKEGVWSSCRLCRRASFLDSFYARDPTGRARLCVWDHNGLWFGLKRAWEPRKTSFHTPWQGPARRCSYPNLQMFN